jgi:hypothetical protein
MSVGALVKYRQAQPATEYLPLATEDEFHRHWLPLAKAQGLQWIPLFAAGLPVTSADIPAVLDEVDRMIVIISAEVSDTGVRLRMLDRATRLRALLEACNSADLEEVFIG